MTKSRWVGLVLLVLGTGMGQAQGAGFLSADVLERAYQAHLRFDGLGESRPKTAPSQPLGEHFFLTVDHRLQDEVLGNFNLPLEALSAGVGGRYTLTPLSAGISMDLFGEMAYLNRYDDLFATEQWQGYGLGGGLRMGIQDAFELEFGVLQNALDNRRDDLNSGLLRYSLGAMYRLTPNFGLTASFTTGEYEKDLQGQDLSEWRFGARLGF
ncbi:MAG TPA: hypothetical protein VNK45_01465 [Candidatus Acidoferrales bacterium]|nr:hypothetical protein [Candidatus Acidoferrales bacterium]